MSGVSECSPAGRYRKQVCRMADLLLRDTNFEDDDDTRREDETVGFVAWFRAVRRGRQGA